jgi:hypothetical protein
MDLPEDPWMDIKWIYKLYDVRAMYTPPNMTHPCDMAMTLFPSMMKPSIHHK